MKIKQLIAKMNKISCENGKGDEPKALRVSDEVQLGIVRARDLIHELCVVDDSYLVSTEVCRVNHAIIEAIQRYKRDNQAPFTNIDFKLTPLPLTYSHEAKLIQLLYQLVNYIALKESSPRDLMIKSNIDVESVSLCITIDALHSHYNATNCIQHIDNGLASDVNNLQMLAGMSIAYQIASEINVDVVLAPNDGTKLVLYVPYSSNQIH